MTTLTTRHLFGILIILLVESFAAINYVRAQESSLPASIRSSLDRNQIPLDVVSIAVSEIETAKPGKYVAKPIIDWRGSEAMNPASTMKILTTLAALDILGPQYRWRTKVFTDGVIRQGTLKGNLDLQGKIGRAHV